MTVNVFLIAATTARAVPSSMSDALDTHLHWLNRGGPLSPYVASSDSRVAKLYDGW